MVTITTCCRTWNVNVLYAIAGSMVSGHHATGHHGEAHYGVSRQSAHAYHPQSTGVRLRQLYVHGGQSDRQDPTETGTVRQVRYRTDVGI